ncbi:unnamed protein product [Vitrella brassicaformis CCMP3155]|uniref:LNR domain-containing protein n=1 Tax=Vitrella brassicaformis (strain CCMP3155) TaxID=1169540 RepID=A0A0G4G9N5_VITBC|nr:unnamed protein product [Vitrella brassicaformis CCMP3155]|eukprot:CEM25231.1 unnamed protein product [Vitrella brassicaformis CCMP3155]
MSRVVHSVVVCGIALLGLLVVYMGGNWRDGSGRQARGGGGSSSHIRKITQRRRRLQGSPSSIPSSCNGVCRSEDWYADGVCDPECFTEECGWDGDDCRGVPRINADQQTENGTNRREFPDTCFGDCRDLEWVNDSVCDLTCYNYACEFDGGDCDPGLECTELASYCKWNETCQSQDDGFGRCESLCSTIECSEDRNEVCEVQRIPEGEPGAGSGVGKCVCAENYVRGDNDECFQVRDCAVAEWKDWGDRFSPFCV